jgi:hypothetical protein
MNDYLEWLSENDAWFSRGDLYRDYDRGDLLNKENEDDQPEDEATSGFEGP